MAAINRFLQNLFLRAPLEIILSVLRMIFNVVMLIIALIVRIFEWFCKFFKGKKFLEEDSNDGNCGRLPEAVIRRPDPCIYSQRLLLEQGLPVTWNNPDIWLTRADDPTTILPDSYHLEEDTNYIVHVRVHNASATDPAIGVRVRLNYRPWSFNSPDLVPVETNNQGDEIMKYVNIFPMGNAITTFKWHTPPLASGDTSKHYCIQASLFHPMDVNTENNMGQENTNVLRKSQTNTAAALQIQVPLFNTTKTNKQYRLQAIKYAIEDEEVNLKLKTTFGKTKRRLSGKIANFTPKRHSYSNDLARFNSSGNQTGKFDFQNNSDVKIQKSKYVGFDDLEKRIKSRDYSIPEYIDITINGQNIDQIFELTPGDKIDLEIKIQNKNPDLTLFEPITIIAIEVNSQAALGGVTFFV